MSQLGPTSFELRVLVEGRVRVSAVRYSSLRLCSSISGNNADSTLAAGEEVDTCTSGVDVWTDSSYEDRGTSVPADCADLPRDWSELKLKTEGEGV